MCVLPVIRRPELHVAIYIVSYPPISGPVVVGGGLRVRGLWPNGSGPLGTPGPLGHCPRSNEVCLPFPPICSFLFFLSFLYPSQSVSARADGMGGWVRPSRARPRGTMGTVPLSFSPLPLMRALRGGPLFPSFRSGSPCPMMKFPPSL